MKLSQTLLLTLSLLALSCLAEANCAGDCQNGDGIYTFPDGAKYVGEWKDGKQNGQGTLILPDGDKHVGLWKDGELQRLVD